MLPRAHMVEHLARRGPDTMLRTVCTVELAVTSVGEADVRSRIRDGVAAASRAGEPAFVKWIVGEQLGGKQLNHMATDPDFEHLKLIPQLAVAVRDHGKSEAPPSSRIGRVYVTLPLPVTSGLPYHLNARFEVRALYRTSTLVAPPQPARPLHPNQIGSRHS